MSRTATSPGYHPDKKIRPKEIALIEEAAKKRKQTKWRESMRMLSPTEISDLRFSLSRVQASGDSASGVRAMRMIEVLEWFEDSIAERERLEAVIDKASELTDAFQELRDNFADELKRDRTDALAEVFADNPEATREQIADLVGEFVTKAFDEAEKDVRAKVDAMQKPIETHVGALEDLSHDDEEA